MMVQQTKTVGELLKLEREERGFSRTQLSHAIRVREQFLVALEENRFQDLPAAVFVKGYVKAYARVLGFDAEPMLALLRRDFQESAKGKLVAQEFLKPAFRKMPTLSPIRLATSGVGGIFLVLFLYIGIRWFSFISPPKIELYEPVEDSIVSPQVGVRGMTELETVVMVNAQAVPVAADGSFEAQITLPNEGIATITVEAKDKQGKTSTVQRTVFVRF
ncbi:MAG: Transcriptional regulator, XRE family [Candidatus Pacebacteria bacterium GW2011_GWB1_47_8]|nr:MAG: Transcriptional regulator, XRE family [Candidatus Pacebacteria bacterium GW2011_GWA1_46_10]KKU84102.1 MAG: Transcriptional regulator, XRE family [Candidatus Pacebacteria bacterium GW2011_GWB1_47_8]